MDAHKRAEMNIFRTEILALLLHEFGLGHKMTEPTNQICSTMGPSEMSIRKARYWFDRFRNRKCKPEDEHRSKVDIDLFEHLIKQDSRLTTRCSVEQLECPHTTIESHLAALGKSWKYGVWILHELSLYQLQHMHEFHNVSPYQSMAAQSLYWRWEVGPLC
jgi:hypothetical protein